MLCNIMYITMMPTESAKIGFIIVFLLKPSEKKLTNSLLRMKCARVMILESTMLRGKRYFIAVPAEKSI